MAFYADYFNGKAASQNPVLVRVVEHTKQIIFEYEGETLAFDFADLRVQAKLGSARRIIDLPNGGSLQAGEISELDSAMPSKRSLFWSALHYLENHLGWVLVSLVATIFAGWLFLQHGVPWLAEHVAKATPPSMEISLGEQVLKGLDHKHGYFSPSKTDKKHQDMIKARLNALCLKLQECPKYRLEFRHGGPIGANALALPGGIMVVTDELIKLSKNDNEVIAVLAHELGHVSQRHAFRQSIQGVLAGLVLAAATGDVSSMASGLPAVLVQMRYSREHETEADTFALNAMQKACVPPKAFAEILQRLHTQFYAEKNSNSQNNKPPRTEKNASSGIFDMLASHPDTMTRIQPFLLAKPACE